MAVYQYLAKDQSDKKFAGVYTDIENTAELRGELAKIGCKLLKARRRKTAAIKNRRIKRSEVATFSYKFAGMYAAGLPILNCLEVLEDQTENRTFQYIISDIRQRVQTGSNLRDACAKHTNVFSNFLIGMIGAGESSHKLETTLNMSAVYLEKREDIKRKVISAFTYPIVVTSMCFVAIAFILIFVMPIFVKLYKQVRVPLPGPTRALVSLSSMAIEYWYAILIVITAGIMIIKWLLKKPQVRTWWDSFKLSMPIFSKLNRMLVISHFTRTFAMLTSVGIPVIEALEVASVVANNHRLTLISKDLQHMIKAGIPIAQSFKSQKIFPTVITQLAASGEQAGQLPQMLNKGSDLLDKEIDKTISSLLTKLEPALTIIMGLVIGMILIGVYLPLFDYMRHLG